MFILSLGEAMNQFLNNNSEEIIKEMKPAATIAIAKHFKGFLNAAFTKLPMKLWLPDAQVLISEYKVRQIFIAYIFVVPV